MAKKWKDLKAKMNPQAQARVDRRVRKTLEKMLLMELRKSIGLTQAALAERLEVSQASVSQLERQDDMRISTLRRIVEALGGELEIVVTLPTGRIAVSPSGLAGRKNAA